MIKIWLSRGLFFPIVNQSFWVIIFLAEWREPWVRECIAGLNLEREWVCRRGSQEADGIQSRCQILSPTTRAKEKITAAEGILSRVVCIYFIVQILIPRSSTQAHIHASPRSRRARASEEGTHQKCLLRCCVMARIQRLTITNSGCTPEDEPF